MFESAKKLVVLTSKDIDLISAETSALHLRE